VRIAILGATGVVGRTMLEVLAERRVDVTELVPLASARSAGSMVLCNDREWLVREPAAGMFEGCRFALFSAGAERSRTWGPVAAAAGAVVIDNSSAFRMDSAVPLVVPEVNAHALADRPRGIIANPNCATIQLVVALEALRRAAGLVRVDVTTFQSVSGAGQKGVDALVAELAGNGSVLNPFPAAIAGNVIPAIGPRTPDGWTEEETKIRNETRKILGMPELRVTATCVRVPVRVGHSASVCVETEHALERARIMEVLACMPGVVCYDDARDPTPLDAAGRDEVRVGRVRVDPDDPRVLHLWIVADNLRKGAATNAVQIAEQVARG
jgi:aspartate-semialdehyde dehydrogenase